MSQISCRQAGCDDYATHVVAETHDLAMLFHHGAGLLCKKHAEAMVRAGGLALSMRGFAEAVRKEQS
jgi:hypothetical protein